MRRGPLIFALLASIVFASDGPAGPPVRRNDELAGMAQAALSNPDFVWKSIEGDGCRIHYQPDSFAARHVIMLLRSAERSMEEGLEFLEEGEYGRRIQVFYVNSREEMKKLTGMGSTGYADSESNSVYLVCKDDWRSFDQHEITHILSLNIWGNPHEPVEWIREGLAVYVDGRCGQYTINDLVGYLLAEDEFPSLKTVIFSFREQNDLIAYLQCGSVIGYVCETYGVEALRKLWDEGAENIESVLGVTLEELEAHWRKHVPESYPGKAEVDWKAIEDHGCG